MSLDHQPGATGPARSGSQSVSPRAQLPAIRVRSGDGQVVKLNFGGQLFTTTRTTLLAGGENFFSGLLGGRVPAELDEHGAYFVDRSGVHFAPILDYLRTGRLLLHAASRDAVFDLARFLLIALPEPQTETCKLEIVYLEQQDREKEELTAIEAILQSSQHDQLPTGYEFSVTTGGCRKVIIPAGAQDWKSVCRKHSEVLANLLSQRWTIVWRSHTDLLPRPDVVYTHLLQRT